MYVVMFSVTKQQGTRYSHYECAGAFSKMEKAVGVVKTLYNALYDSEDLIVNLDDPNHKIYEHPNTKIGDMFFAEIRSANLVYEALGYVKSYRRNTEFEFKP